MASARGRHGDRAARRRAARGAGAGAGRRRSTASTTPRPREIARRAASRRTSRDQVADVVAKLWDVFVAEDATLVEVNPLVEDQDGQVVALDGKVTLDDNADFRHPDHAALADRARADPLEAEGQGEGPQLRQARRRGRHHRQRRRPGHEHPRRRRLRRGGVRRGRSPRTSSTSAAARQREVMANGLDIILVDPEVKAVFVNVFGGITACDAVANGIVQRLELLEETARRSSCRWSSGSTATTPRRADEILDTRRRCQPARSSGSTRWTTPRAARPSWPPRARDREPDRWRSCSTDHSKVLVQGMTGSEGTQAHPADGRLRHARRRRGHPRQGRADGGVRRQSACRCSTRSARRWPRPARTSRSCSCPPRSPRPRSSRRSTPACRSSSSSPRACRCTTRRPSSSTRRTRARTRIIGPNCPGLISPGQLQRRHHPGEHHQAGPIGLVSKSGTLTYQMMYELRDIGFSTDVGIGGDPVIGTTHIDCLAGLRGGPRDRRPS